MAVLIVANDKLIGHFKARSWLIALGRIGSAITARAGWFSLANR